MTQVTVNLQGVEDKLEAAGRDNSGRLLTFVQNIQSLVNLEVLSQVG